MRILISYSRYHFDPQVRRGLTYSASWIARAIYDVCSELGDVTYIDPSETRSLGTERFDLFIGQINQFGRIHSLVHPTRSVLFMATTHPANRNRVMKLEAKKFDLPVSETMPRKLTAAFDCADLVLQLGGDWALEALLRAGVERSKILNIHYGVDHVPLDKKRVFAKPYRFLFLATKLGLRKGVARALEAFMGLDGDYLLTLSGKIPTPDYAQIVSRAIERDSRIQLAGWVETGTDEFLELLGTHHYFVSTSVEDVETGTLQEAMNSGLVPITTKERVGIPYSPLGDFSLTEPNSALLKRAMSLSSGELRALSRQSRHYVDTFHSWSMFKRRLREILEKAADGKLEETVRPKVSLILPVHNKESDLVRLLRQLYRSVKTFKNIELHIIFDGCIDRSREKAEAFMSRTDLDVKYHETPNIFETRASNLGLRAAQGKYCVLMQDDNYIYDAHWVEKLVYFMDTNPGVGAVGGLAGVCFYPSAVELSGPGVSTYQFERSRRIETRLGNAQVDRIYEVDAVMRGPIMLRKNLLEAFGYLDEEGFSPYFMDDMDLCMRLRDEGYVVFYYPLDVVNERSTIIKYDSMKASRWQNVVDRNLRLFYDRWNPDGEKSFYLNLQKSRFNNLYSPRRQFGSHPIRRRFGPRGAPRRGNRVSRFLKLLMRIFDSGYCASLADRLWKNRVQWTQEQIAFLPAGTKVLEIGAGPGYYRRNFAHCLHTALDLFSHSRNGASSIDIVGDVSALSFKGASYQSVVLTEVLEHVTDPVGALREIARILCDGGKLVLTAPLGSGVHQSPHHYFGGYTRHFYEKMLPELGFEIVSIEANGGLFGHLVEMNGKAYSYIDRAMQKPFYWPIRYFLRTILRNIPAVAFSYLDDRFKVEEYTVGYHVIAIRRSNPNASR